MRLPMSGVIVFLVAEHCNKNHRDRGKIDNSAKGVGECPSV